MLVGAIQLVVGGSVYLRTPAQRAVLEVQALTEPARFKAGLAVTLTVGQPFWLGIGMGMLVQGALMLPADITAERRGAIYQAAVVNGG